MDAHHIKITRPNRNLNWKTHRHLPSRKTIGSHSYELGLPADIKIDVIHVIPLLATDINDPLLVQITPPQPPVLVGGDKPVYHGEAAEDSYLFRVTLR